MARLDAIDARGSTNLSEGWFRGAEQVASHLAADGVNRCLVLTDGLANKGLTDPASSRSTPPSFAPAACRRRRSASATDFDEALLQGMADAGGGHFYFVRDAATIRDHITSEVGETLEIVARDVELEVVAAEDVGVEAISPAPDPAAWQPDGHRSRRSRRGAGPRRGPSHHVPVRARSAGRPGVIIALTDRDGVFAAGGRASASDARLSWAYADDAANDAQPRDTEVDRAVATQFAARARQEAVRLNRAGDYESARRILDATGRRIRAYAGRDPRAPRHGRRARVGRRHVRRADGPDGPQGGPLRERQHGPDARLAGTFDEAAGMSPRPSTSCSPPSSRTSTRLSEMTSWGSTCMART